MALVRADLGDGTEVLVGESFAESHDLKIVETEAPEPDTALGPQGLVRARLEDGTEVSVGASFAASKKLSVLEDEPATHHGRTIPATTAGTLRGKALNEALTAAGLETSGSLKERQQRLSDFQTSGATVGGTSTPAGQTGS